MINIRCFVSVIWRLILRGIVILILSFITLCHVVIGELVWQLGHLADEGDTIHSPSRVLRIVDRKELCKTHMADLLLSEHVLLSNRLIDHASKQVIVTFDFVALKIKVKRLISFDSILKRSRVACRIDETQPLHSSSSLHTSTLPFACTKSLWHHGSLSHDHYQ